MQELISESDFLLKYNINQEEYHRTGLEWDELKEIYEDHLNNKLIFEQQLQTLFSHLITINGVHSVRFRVKDAEHLLEKIIRKKIENRQRNISTQTYFNEIDDLIGIRVLHLFKDEWEDIHQFIIDNWDLKEKQTAYYRIGDSEEYLEQYRKKDCDLKEHKYGYRSVHYIIKQKILSISFSCEIQVRTVFEEAWSEIDHIVRYPYDMENPLFKNYLSIFNRLAGSADEMGTFLIMLKEHLAGLYHEAEMEKNNANKLINDLLEEVSALKIDKENLNSLVNKLKRLNSEINENNSFSSSSLRTMVNIPDYMEKSKAYSDIAASAALSRSSFYTHRNIENLPYYMRVSEAYSNIAASAALSGSSLNRANFPDYMMPSRAYSDIVASAVLSGSHLYNNRNFTNVSDNIKNIETLGNNSTSNIDDVLEIEKTNESENIDENI